MGLGLGAAPGLATCGSTACFLSTLTQDGSLAKSAFRLDLSYRYVDQSRKRSGTSSTDEVLTPGVDFAPGEMELDHHREIKTAFQLLQPHLVSAHTPHLTLLAPPPPLSL